MRKQELDVAHTNLDSLYARIVAEQADLKRARRNMDETGERKLTVHKLLRLYQKIAIKSTASNE